jgi:hypothetical protein
MVAEEQELGLMLQEQQEQLTPAEVVAEVEEEQVEVQEDQELLLLVKHVDHQLTTLHPESGQLMTHLITKKMDSGLQHQCRRLAQII